MKLPRFLSRKDNPAYRSIFATFGMKQPVWRTVDYASFIKEGYIKCAPVHACISMTAKAGSGVRWYLMKGDKELKEQHELLTRLARPNRYESGPRFVENVFTFLLATGNVFIYRNSGLSSSPPKNLYWLRPDRTKIERSADWRNPVAGYTYNAGSSPQFMPEELVLHLKEPHPLSDWEGLSRIQVAAHDIDIWNESVAWNLKLLQNSMQVPGVVTGRFRASPQDFAKLKETWHERYQGSEAHSLGSPLFLDGEDIKWQNISGSAKDSDWSEGQRRVLRSICAVMGVPSQLLGDTEATTYANYQEARKAFYLETVLPLLDFYRDELNYWLVPLYGDNLRLEYDRDSIEALQEDRGKKYGYLEGSRFLKLNEKRAAAGYEDIPEGDVVLVGMGEMSLEDAVAPPEPAPAPVVIKPAVDDAAVDEDGKPLKSRQKKSLGGFWRGANERKALWQNFERRITVKEKAFGREVKAWLEGQARSFIEAYTRDGQATYDTAAAAKSYAEKFTPRYRKLYGTALAAGRSLTEGKLYEFNEDDKADGGWVSPEVRAKLEKLIADSAKVITDETLAEIQAVMRDSLGSNLTVQEIAGALKDKLVDQMPTVRARRIARTETGMLENAGNLDGFKENEFVNRKGWLCSFVEASRDEHMAADGQEVGIDESFKVGGDEMEYPLDRSHGAEAGNVINCLCAIYPVVE